MQSTSHCLSTLTVQKSRGISILSLNVCFEQPLIDMRVWRLVSLLRRGVPSIDRVATELQRRASAFDNTTCKLLTPFSHFNRTTRKKPTTILKPPQSSEIPSAIRHLVDVVALQEVRPEVYKHLVQKLGTFYHFSHAPDTPYFTVLLLRKDRFFPNDNSGKTSSEYTSDKFYFSPFVQFPFPTSNMERDVLFTTISPLPTSFPTAEITVATTHLESLSNELERCRQMMAIRDIFNGNKLHQVISDMRGEEYGKVQISNNGLFCKTLVVDHEFKHENVIIVGDFNIDDRSNFPNTPRSNCVNQKLENDNIETIFDFEVKSYPKQKHMRSVGRPYKANRETNDTSGRWVDAWRMCHPEPNQRQISDTHTATHADVSQGGTLGTTFDASSLGWKGVARKQYHRYDRAIVRLGAAKDSITPPNTASNGHSDNPFLRSTNDTISCSAPKYLVDHKVISEAHETNDIPHPILVGCEVVADDIYDTFDTPSVDGSLGLCETGEESVKYCISDHYGLLTYFQWI